MDRLRILLRSSGIGALLFTLFLPFQPVAQAMRADLPVADEDFACIPQTRAQSYVQGFNIDVASFGGLELCDSKIDTKKLFNDLQLVEEGRFNDGATNIFIQNFVPADQYFSWLKQQTRSIERGNDVPWATAYNSWGAFTMQDGWAALSTLGRVGTVIHEARHTEGYGHTSCEHGPYKGSSVSGCDSSVQAAGSHGVEMEYYARVSLQGANFHPAYKAMARLMLLGRSNFVFNENPLAAKDSLLAHQPGRLTRLKGEDSKSIVWNFPVEEELLLKKTSFGATLLSLTGQAWALDLDRQLASLHSDDYSYFKLLKTSPPANFVDMEEFDVSNRRYFLALDNTQRLHSYIFGQGKWKMGKILDGIKRLTTTGPLGDEGLFAIFDDGSYCAINFTKLECQGGKMEWPDNTRKFVQFRGGLLRLDDQGIVFNSDGERWTGLGDGDVLDFVKIPQYDVFE